MIYIFYGSSQYFADLPNRCNVCEIGYIPPQYRPCLSDSHVVAIPGFKIEISDAYIGRCLIPTTGNTLFYICFYVRAHFFTPLPA